MLVALDIDGVVVDMDTHFKQVAQDLYGIPLVKVSPSYTFHQRYEGLTKEMEINVWQHIEEAELWATAPIYEDVAQSLALLREANMDVMFISAAPNKVEAQRKINLAPLDLHDSHVICVGTGTPSTLANKRNALLQYAPDIFVDDQLHNLVQALECNVPYLSWIDLGDEQIHFDKDWKSVAHHRAGNLLEASQHLVSQYEKVPPILRKRIA